MLRKILSVLLMSCLLFSTAVFAEGELPEGESGHVIPEGRIGVTYWNLIDGKDADVLNAIVDEYNASQDVAFIDNVTWTWGDYYTKLRLAILSGTGPDMALSHGDNIPSFYAAGCLVCIEDEFERLGVDFDMSNCVSPAMDSITFDGKYYSVPQDVLAAVMLYNKGVYGELGLLDENGMPNFFGSMADWQAAAQKVEENYDMFGTGMSDSGFFASGAFLGLYYQLGGDTEWLGEDGLTVELDDEIALKALEQFKELYAFNAPEGAGFDLFANEGAPMTIEGTWAVNAAINTCTANGIDIGICAFPALLNPESKAEASWSHTLFLPKNDARTDEVTTEALKFIKYFYENGDKWAQAGHLPSNGLCYETDFFKSLPLRTDYQNAPQHNQVFPGSPALQLYTASEFNTPIEQFLRNEISAEDCVTAIKANLEEIIAAYKAGGTN